VWITCLSAAESQQGRPRRAKILMWHVVCYIPCDCVHLKTWALGGTGNITNDAKQINSQEEENSMNTFLRFVMALALAGVMVGCEKGPAEEAGENIDKAVEDVRDGVEDACEEATDENC
jgi:hypothetical protein